MGEDEFMTLWENSLNVKGSDGDMNLEGFVKFNAALDELFEFEDDELEVEDEEEHDHEVEDDKGLEISVVAPIL